MMEIKNVRFSYALLRGPTEEEDRLVEKGFSATLRMTAAEALPIRVAMIVGYNPQKLLPSPERLAREWHEAMLRLFDFPKSWLDEEIDFSASLMRSRTPTFRIPILPPGEEIKTLIANAEVPIFVKDIDYGHAEMRVLASALRTTAALARFREATENAQLRLYALGVMLGEPYMPKSPPEPQDTRVSTSAGKRDMSYLKHDRTKQHRRRRR